MEEQEKVYGVGVGFDNKDEWEKFVDLYNALEIDDEMTYDDVPGRDHNDESLYPIRVSFATFTCHDLETDGFFDTPPNVEAIKKLLQIVDAGYTFGLYKLDLSNLIKE